MSEAQGATKETNDNITADAIIKKIGELNGKVITATERAKTNLDNLKQRLAQSGIDAQKQKEQITSLTDEIRELQNSNTSLAKKAADLKEINGQITKLEANINNLLSNNEQITGALNYSSDDQLGGFQYNKKNIKYKGQSRSLHSNSKTTPRKRKKWRRRPGKSVKKGGMKTRRRRRNKKSKKSKKRRK